jgi:hypothetical protein
MIIWGHGRKIQTLGPVGRIDSCPNCGNPTTLYLGVLKKDFKLYFVPVARWNSQYFLYCEICNASAEIDRDMGRQIHEGLQSGTAGLRHASAVLRQLGADAANEFRSGDIIKARRDISEEGRIVIREGERLRAQSVPNQHGALLVQNDAGESLLVSRGHLEVVRRGITPLPGETWVLTTNIIGGKSKERLGVKGQHLEVVTTSKDGKTVSVVDDQGNQFWVTGMLLDPYEEPVTSDTEPYQSDTPELEPLYLLRAAEPSAIYESLRNLDALHKDGILSQEEFQSKKAELLSRF